MTQKTVGMIALAAMLACSACADRTTKTATFITPASQQAVAIKWEEATAASSSARVNNTSLIFMR